MVTIAMGTIAMINLLLYGNHCYGNHYKRCVYCFYCFSLPNVITECSIPETWDTLDGSSDANVLNFPKSPIIGLNPNVLSYPSSENNNNINGSLSSNFQHDSRHTGTFASILTHVF